MTCAHSNIIVVPASGCYNARNIDRLASKKKGLTSNPQDLIHDFFITAFREYKDLGKYEGHLVDGFAIPAGVKVAFPRWHRPFHIQVQSKLPVSYDMIVAYR